MHRSRLYGVFVDAPLADAADAVRFWAGALGATPAPQAPGDPFTALTGATSGDVVFEVQAVDDAPRYHVDIETDDVPAEAARLVGLGAVEVHRYDAYRVLRAPGGHLLCVVPVQSDPALFDRDADTWDADTPDGGST